MLFNLTLTQTALWMLGITAGAGLVCRLLGRRLRSFSAALALAASAAVFALSIGVFMTGRAGAQAFSFGSLSFPFGGGYAFALEGRVTAFSGLVAMGTAFFALLTTVYSLRYARRQRSAGAYYGYMLWATAGAFVAALSDNLLLLLVGWEVVTMMLYLLIALGGERAKEGAAKTFIMLGLSDAALMMGIVLLAFVGKHSLLMSSYGGKASIYLTQQPVFYGVVFLLFFVGATAKAGAMPFHTWIPSASEGGPLSVMAFLPAAVDKLLGIYLLAFVSLNMFVLNPAMQWVLLIVGAVTLLAAVLMAMVQHDVRRLLSYHAVSQVGYMVLGIGTGSVIGIAGGLFHMINHAIYKSCLFMSAGAVEDRTGETEVNRLGGLGAAMPVTFACMFVAAMAISGVPPLNGFVSKWMVYQGTLEIGPWGVVFLAVAVFGSALTLASFVKVLHAIFFGRKPVDMKEEPAGKAGRFALNAPMVVLALLCLLLGIFAPVVLSQAVAPSMKTLSALDGAFEKGGEGGVLTAGAAAMDFTKGLWEPGMATLLIVLGVVLGLVVFFLGRGSKVRVQPPFTAAETLVGDEGRYLGTNFYKTVEDLPMIGTACRDAQAGVYDVYYIGGRFGGTLVRALKRAHSGNLPVYVSWGVIGLALIVTYLLRFA